MKPREGMEERGFIEAAGKSSVIALWWIRGMREGWSEVGRNVKFVHLLGAVLNSGVINVVERRVLTKHSLLFKGHLWVLQRGKSCKRG